MQDSFNLLVEKWIPVIFANEKKLRVGIRQAPIEAGHIRQIAVHNPIGATNASCNW
jgi:hypothetical protein